MTRLANLITSFCIAFFFLTSICNGQKWASDMFEIRSHDFGTVANGSNVEYRFKVTNKYIEDIHISHVSSSCGCTTPSITKKTLKTWETGEIVAKFNTTSFRGHKSATIRVAIDRPYPAEVQLEVKGNIRADLAFEPGVIEFGEVPQSEKKRMSIRIIKRGNPNWKINDVESTYTGIRVGLREVTRNFNEVIYEMIAELQDDAPTGFVNGELHLVTNEPNTDKVPVNFLARVVPEIQVTPEVVPLGVVEPGEVTEKKIFVRAKRPFQITGIECKDPCLNIESGDENKKTQILTVRYTAPTKTGRHECEAKIMTSLGTNFIGSLKAVATVEKKE